MRVHFFGMIWIKINDPGSFKSWCMKGTDESTVGKDLLVPLMHHDTKDPRSLILIQIIPKKPTLREEQNSPTLQIADFKCLSP